MRNLNAFVSLGRFEDAFRLLSAALACRRPNGWRFWAEVVWGEPQSPEYIGDMPHTWIGAEFATAIRRMLLRENEARSNYSGPFPTPGGRVKASRCMNCRPPSGSPISGLDAINPMRRSNLALTGPAPERITFRYPGAKQARADGRPCEIHGDVISAPNLNRLVIDF